MEFSPFNHLQHISCILATNICSVVLVVQTDFVLEISNYFSMYFKPSNSEKFELAVYEFLTFNIKNFAIHPCLFGTHYFMGRLKNHI